MKLRISTVVGNWQCHVDVAIPEDKVEKVVKRSAALAFAAGLASKQAGGKISNFGLLDRHDIEARFANREASTSDCTFANLTVEPYVPASQPKDPVATLEAAIKSGTMAPEKLAALRALLG